MVHTKRPQQYRYIMMCVQFIRNQKHLHPSLSMSCVNRFKKAISIWKRGILALYLNEIRLKSLFIRHHHHHPVLEKFSVAERLPIILHVDFLRIGIGFSGERCSRRRCVSHSLWQILNINTEKYSLSNANVRTNERRTTLNRIPVKRIKCMVNDSFKIRKIRLNLWKIDNTLNKDLLLLWYLILDGGSYLLAILFMLKKLISLNSSIGTTTMMMMLLTKVTITMYTRRHSFGRNELENENSLV